MIFALCHSEPVTKPKGLTCDHKGLQFLNSWVSLFNLFLIQKTQRGTPIVFIYFSITAGLLNTVSSCVAFSQSPATEVMGLFSQSMYLGESGLTRFPCRVKSDRGLVFADGSPCSSDTDLDDILEDVPEEENPAGASIKTEV